MVNNKIKLWSTINFRGDENKQTTQSYNAWSCLLHLNWTIISVFLLGSNKQFYFPHMLRIEKCQWKFVISCFYRKLKQCVDNQMYKYKKIFKSNFRVKAPLKNYGYIASNWRTEAITERIKWSKSSISQFKFFRVFWNQKHSSFTEVASVSQVLYLHLLRRPKHFFFFKLPATGTVYFKSL